MLAHFSSIETVAERAAFVSALVFAMRGHRRILRGAHQPHPSVALWLSFGPLCIPLQMRFADQE
jgi:hypothetical protein